MYFNRVSHINSDKINLIKTYKKNYPEVLKTLMGKLLYGKFNKYNILSDSNRRANQQFHLYFNQKLINSVYCIL